MKRGVKWDEFSAQQRKFLEGKKVIIEVHHFQMDSDLGIGYVVKFISPKEYDWKWFMEEDYLRSNFIKLDENPSKNRFLFMK
ncbi:MAG: hypothetical protein NWE76_02465 [Candidatus Bathyarchaeota archaeon]|nr:hypothetical protein [Candidatus Bathyarchaeota archaeon]